jgi:hypothetical protein
MCPGVCMQGFTQLTHQLNHIIHPVVIKDAIAVVNKKIGVNKITLPSILSSLQSTSQTCSTAPCGALPVTLLSFEARRISITYVNLDWKTTNEYNNAGFDVERSLANNTKFVKVAFVPARQNPARINKYQLQDENSLLPIKTDIVDLFYCYLIFFWLSRLFIQLLFQIFFPFKIKRVVNTGAGGLN